MKIPIGDVARANPHLAATLAKAVLARHELKNWHVNVYDENDEKIATWSIESRTEQQAAKEAMREVETHHVGYDWSLTQA